MTGVGTRPSPHRETWGEGVADRTLVTTTHSLGYLPPLLSPGSVPQGTHGASGEGTGDRHGGVGIQVLLEFYDLPFLVIQ